MEQHIIPHRHAIDRKVRETLQRHRAICIWFTGLSGSGKSTVANELEKRLYEKGYRTYVLDGDNLRAGLNNDLNFSVEDRSENIRRVGEVAKLLLDAGCIVLSAFISPIRKDREKVKAFFPSSTFVEVFVECPIEVCVRRDVKGLYAKAKNGEIKGFTGIDSPFEPPLVSDIALNTVNETIEESVDRLLKLILPKIKINTGSK